MICRPAPLVALVSVILACVTGIGSFTSALWLFSSQEITLACAVLAFAALVAPGELLGGSALAVRLAKRSPYGNVLRWIVGWVLASLTAIGLALSIRPDPWLILSLGSLLTLVGGLCIALRERTAWAFVRSSLPWLSGALPLSWLCFSLPSLSLAQVAFELGLLVVAVALPVGLAALALRRGEAGSFTRDESRARIRYADRANSLSLSDPWSTRAAVDPRVSAVGLSGVRGGFPADKR